METLFRGGLRRRIRRPGGLRAGDYGGGKPSLSFSFANGNGTNHILVSPSTVDPLGIEAVPVANWIDLVDEDNGTINAVDVIPAGDDHAYNFTLPTPVTVTYSAKNGYEYTAGAPQTFLQAYLDDGENPNNNDKGALITVKGVPFTRYDVIVYLATDTQSAKFLPVTVNGAKYIGTEAGSQKVTDNTTTWGVSRETVPNLGKNALRVNGLEGTTLTIEGSNNNNSGKNRCGIAAFQIICSNDGALRPSTQPVLSLNFASGRSEGITESKVATETGNYGLAVAPADTWVDLTGAVDTDTQRNVTKLHGNPTVEGWLAAKVTWKAANTWSYGSAAAADAEPFLPTYLDDGVGNGANGVAVSVSSVPFEAYDAIVYFSNDAGRKYRPVQINNNYYTYNDAYGAIVVGGVAEKTQREDPNAFGEVGQQATAKLGVNALRVNGLKGEFSLQGASVTITGSDTSGYYDRAGIAAVQLVARQLITVSGQTDWATLTADLDLTQPLLVVVQDGASITGNVTLPADAILDLSGYTFGETAPFTGTLTMNGGTIRLPARFDSAKIAASISGSFTCFIGDEFVWLSNQDGTLSLSYEWWGLGGDDLWSNPLNWSSGRVPNENAEVSFNLGASDETVILDKAATVASVTITGSESSAATLNIQAQEGGSLTVSGQMLTTGNVTVTQSADITVNGASTMGDGSPIPQTQVVQAGFQVNGSAAGYTVASGTLSVQVPAGGGDVSVSNGGTLTVGEGGTLSASRAIATYYDKSTTSTTTSGTLSIAGRATFSTQLSLSSSGFSVKLAGGTLETPYVNSSSQGLNVSAASIFVGSWPTELNARGIRGSTKTFTGAGNLTLQGEVCFKYEVLGATGLVSGDSVITADYTGELIADANSSVSLGENRPKLTVRENAKVTVTPTSDEAESGTIVFPTSMKTLPANVTYTVDVNGVEKTPFVTVNDNEDTLTLSWEADYPTLSTSGSWSTGSWQTSAGSTGAPSEGSAILDGTVEGGITVTLDTDLLKMKSIFVKGDVTLVTKGTQFTTIPACVKLTTGATLTIDANFSDAWELPAGYTLQVTKGFTSFANLTLEGAVVILEGVSGTEIDASSVQFNGGLTIAASNLTLKSVYNVGTTLALEGDNITIEGNSLFTDNGTEVVNMGTGNAITGMTGLNGTLAVERGSLALTLAGNQPTITSFLGATIAKDATLTLAGTSGWFPATGAGTYAVGTNRPQFAAVGGATTTPAIITATATAEEQSAGTITFANYQSAVSFPEGFEAKITPYGTAAPWVTVAQAGGNTLRILNVPAPNGLSGLDDEVALALRQAAAKAGITNGDYTVRLTTGGQTAAASAATLNDVLGCFTGLTATANDEKTTLTYAYEFGIVGVRRTADAWEVVVKVQGAGGAAAGFAKGNVYTVNGATVESPDETQAAQGKVVLPVTEEQLKAGASVSVARPTEP